MHGYIHVWISDLGRAVDISMDIMLAHLLSRLTTDMFSLSHSFMPLSRISDITMCNS